MSTTPHTAGVAAAPPHGDHAHGGHGADGTHSAHGGHGDHGHHNPDVAHHFDTANQQFDAGKLGIWAFLVTEVLFFSGLFCAYSIWRNLNPEVFLYAHHYLDTTLGATNTVVLLFSSLTAAWAVRCAQLNQKKGLVLCLSLTLLCAFGFLGVKYVEYSHKLHDGIGWGTAYQPHNPKLFSELSASGHYLNGRYVSEIAAERNLGIDGVPYAELDSAGKFQIAEQLRPEFLPEPVKVRTFFGIYYGMTGLHGVHVLGGILVFVWLLVRALKGQFHAGYFGPVDYAALYWHLVDLVWIYLFPMLYLIH